MAAYEYFYDEQIRRFLLQTVRAFSGFQYKVAGRASVDNGQPQLLTVPCRVASQNRQVGHILRNNSENTIMSVPQLTVWIKEMNLARERTQSPSHVSSVQVTERAVDINGAYTGAKGNGYSVERQMPHPLDITIQVDLWTSNEHQKHQIWEQVYMAFNVGFDIQSSENPLDWTALTTMTLDSVVWSSRSIPIGTNDEIDVASFTFKLPVWITPPAKVKQQKLINQIVTNIIDGQISSEDDIDDGMGQYATGTQLSQVIVSPDNAQIQIQGNEVTLLTSAGEVLDSTGNILDWQKLLLQYGTLYPAQSQLRIRQDIEQPDSMDIVGTIQLHSSKKNVLIWQPDVATLPVKTQDPVDAIIDPVKHYPKDAQSSSLVFSAAVLPIPTLGQRYMLMGDLGSNTQAWGPILDIRGNMFVPSPTSKATSIGAFSGDIIQYMASGHWQVVFSAAATTVIQYVLNLKSGKQLKFVDGSWIMAIDGEYHPGFWRLRL